MQDTKSVHEATLTEIHSHMLITHLYHGITLLFSVPVHLPHNRLMTNVDDSSLLFIWNVKGDKRCFIKWIQSV